MCIIFKNSACTGQEGQTLPRRFRQNRRRAFEQQRRGLLDLADLAQGHGARLVLAAALARQPHCELLDGLTFVQFGMINDNKVSSG